MKRLLSILIVFIPALSFGINVDSLYQKLNTLDSDTAKISLLGKVIKNNTTKDVEHCRILALKQVELANNLGDKKYIADAYLHHGLVFEQKNYYDSALIKYNRALEIYTDLNSNRGISEAELSLGIVYYLEQEYPDALSHFYNALRLKDEIHDDAGKSAVYNNIANIYLDQGKYKTALDYYLKSLAIDKTLDDKKGLAAIYNNLGIVYRNLKDYQKAIEYNKLALKAKIYLGDKKGLANSYNNLGRIYFHQGKFEESLKFSKKALKIEQKIHNREGMGQSLINIGEVFMEQDLLDSAIVNIEEGVKQSLLAGSKETLSEGYKVLAEAYERAGETSKAFESYKLYATTKDSLSSQDSEKHIQELQTKFRFGEQNRQIDLLKREKEIDTYKAQQQKTFINSLYGGLALLVIIAALIYNRYRVKQKANKQLESQNIEIEEKSLLLGEKNKEITDSIKYAQHIQNAILPHDSYMKDCLNDYFVLYKPKDIVSGDFYWVQSPLKRSGIGESDTENELVLFSVVDCTGHGVPGAFMSIVGNNGLNGAINERYYTKPSDILNHLNKHVVRTLSQKENDETMLKDGMDLSLCALRKTNGEIILDYAGANNSVWIVSKNNRVDLITEDTLYFTHEGNAAFLHEIKADKHPIGMFLGTDLKPFTNHSVRLNKGDCVYVFSDGYADQFGGGKGKKFKQSKMKNLLATMLELPMEEQGELLDRTIENWKGNRDQIDDICLMGVRV